MNHLQNSVEGVRDSGLEPPLFVIILLLPNGGSCSWEDTFSINILQIIKILCNFAAETAKHYIMTAIIERTPRSITVRMSTRRWKKMLDLERAYKLACIIKRSMEQVKTEPSMTVDEAINTLRAL